MSETIRKCREEDIPKLFELFKTVYPANPLLQERSYFDWQFKNTPFQDREEYSFWILWEGSSIKGILGYVPIKFRYRDKVYQGCWTHNWFSLSQDTSGLKLLTRLMADYDHRFLIGLSMVSESIYEMYKIPLLRQMHRWIGIVDQKAMSSLFEINDPSDHKKLCNSYELLINNKDSDGIYPLRRFNANEDFSFEQWDSIKGGCLRTGKYLNWRYIDIPRHNYQAIANDKGGFAVYRIETIKGFEESVIRIVEWTFKGRWAKKALAAILQEGIRNGSILVDFFCTAEEVGNELTKLGFLPEANLRSKIPYLFRPIYHTDGIQVAIDMPPHRTRRTFNFNEWYITKGDSDIDRSKL